MSEVIRVKTLGEFEVSNEYGILNDRILHSNMLKKLLMYLLLHRNTTIGIMELSEALWEGEEIQNPVRAVNNLIYRLRNIMKRQLGEENYIITGQGRYAWNKELEVSLDVEELERISKKKYEDTTDRSSQIMDYENAISLYNGNFLESLFDVHWAMVLSTYYHSQYMEIIKKLCALYLEKASYVELESLCISCLQNETIDEDLYYYYILSLIKQKKYELAMSKYEEASGRLYQLLGVKKIEKLEGVWEEIRKIEELGVTGSLSLIHKELNEREERRGVYFCSFPMFKEIYRLEVRKNYRRAKSDFIILFTLSLKSEDDSIDNSMKDYLVGQGMKNLREVIQSVLRTGDVASRYSKNQYLILLSTCTYENSVRVAERVINSFEKYYRKKIVKIRIEFEQIPGVNSV